jgi:hypothetical protein
VGAAADIRYDLEGWAWTVTGNYRMVAGSTTLDLLAGARLLDIESALVGRSPVTFRRARPRSRGAHTSRVHNVDAIVGCKGRSASAITTRGSCLITSTSAPANRTSRFRRWPGLGTFDWGDAFVALRYLDYDMASGSTIKALTFDGRRSRSRSAGEHRRRVYRFRTSHQFSSAMPAVIAIGATSRASS